MSAPLVNEHFNGFPIDYFRIKQSDFANAIGGQNPDAANALNERDSARIRKSIIEPDDSGRIFTALSQVLDLEESDTTIINASVGQGKTYSILKTVETYFNEHPDTYIFIAVPFVSLVEQYYRQLIELGIPEDDIYRYEWLDPSHPNANLTVQIARRIHIVTVNCLLGNAGENSIINSSIKRKYLQGFSNFLRGDEYAYDGRPINPDQIDRLSKQQRFDRKKLRVFAGRNRKKAIFIYDEIHDAIHNFKQNNIFNLWHWQDSIHKNIIISATYNDASIPVIEYLSKLTNNKIHIIDSTKEIIRENQSKLYLHFNANKFYKSKDTIICNVVKDSLEKGKNIDILCYSKSLAEDIKKSNGVKDILEQYVESVDINLCVSELISNQRSVRNLSGNRYDEYKANIGTTFKTGVNIEKENHSLIIIFPPESTKMPFKNFFGIFSGGVNDVIQALARQRVKGEIHLILPLPERMDFSTLEGMTAEQKEFFIEAYKKVSQPNVDVSVIDDLLLSRYSDTKVKFKYLDTQRNIVREKYEQFIGSIMLPVIRLSNDENLKFPDLLSFRIERGAKAINRDKFLGSDLSSFITYCAFTNQFINCRLAGYNIATLYFERETLIEDLEEKYEEVLANLDDEYNSDLYRVYNGLLDRIYDGKKVFLDNTKINRANPVVRKAILKILLKIENPDYFSDDLPYKNLFGDEFNHLNYMMLLLQYIYHNKRTNGNGTFSEPITNLFRLRERLIESLYENRNSKYLKPIEHNNIFQELGINASELLESLANEYPLLLESRTFKNVLMKSNEEKENDLYNYLTKSIGKFDKARRYAFLDYEVKKLDSDILNVPFS